MSDGVCNGNKQQSSDNVKNMNSEAYQQLSSDSKTARMANQQAYRTSNIFASNDSSTVDGNLNKSGKSYVMTSNVFSDSAKPEVMTPRRSSKPSSGNPITGEGYSNGSSDGQRRENSPHVQKGRQPPGGHASKLW